MKYFFYILLFLSTFWYSTPHLFAAESDSCGNQEGYGMYECRSQNICESYASEKPVYNVEDYGEAETAKAAFQNNQSHAPALDAAKELYRKNMGNIYKCAMIQAQKNALEFLMWELKQEKSWELDDSIWGQIELRVNRLEIAANTVGCTLSDGETIQNKLNILRETTTEACRYVSYLEYLKAHYQKTDRFWDEAEYQNAYGTDAKLKGKFPLWEMPAIMNEVDSQIAEEISHTYKVFPIAYHAYSEYENNFPIHFLLEIVRADFMILRQRLKENLMPLAQLGLKVINATSY